MGLRIVDRKPKSAVNSATNFEEETKKWFLSKHDYCEEKHKDFLEKYYSVRERLKKGKNKGSKDDEKVKEFLKLAESHIKTQDSESTKSQKPIDLGTMLELLELKRTR